MSEADRASCARIALDLVNALEELGTTCALTSADARSRARDDPGRETWLSHVIADVAATTTRHHGRRSA
jgi:hypothetical protein